VAHTPDMAQSLTLKLDRFGREAIDAYLRRHGSSESGLLAVAIRYYLADAASGAIAWPVPRFGERMSGQDVVFDVDDATYAELEREAGRQEVTPERLAQHALIYFLADLESGRVAARLGDALGRDAEAE
jgi:hypothetical protein